MSLSGELCLVAGSDTKKAALGSIFINYWIVYSSQRMVNVIVWGSLIGWWLRYYGSNILIRCWIVYCSQRKVTVSETGGSDTLICPSDPLENFEIS